MQGDTLGNLQSTHNYGTLPNVSVTISSNIVCQLLAIIKEHICIVVHRRSHPCARLRRLLIYFPQASTTYAIALDSM